VTGTGDLSVLGICGSLRRGSYNRALLRAAIELAPADMRIEAADLDGIPLFDQDVEARGMPAPAAALADRIRAADAVLIATPEYNWGVAGVLKNAFDWVSRPLATNALKGKPVAIVGASTGPWGTVRAQLQLRQSLAYVDALALPQPNVFVPMAEQKFDAEGRLTDARTREQLVALLVALASWTRRVSA
jgi:chromate reductase